MQVLVATCGLDFVTTYFSDELVAGFTTGASLHVFVTQFKDILGLKGLPNREGLANAILKVYDLFANITRTNLVTLGLSALTILMILLGKHVLNPFVKKRLRCPIPLPMELIAVIAGTLISQFAHLKDNFNVPTVGLIPSGLPPPALPHFDLFPSLVVDAVSISAVVMAIHVSLAKVLAKKYQYEIDSNQEFYAMGFSSVLSGFFPVFPQSCSISRTMVSASAGTRTLVKTVSLCDFHLSLVKLWARDSAVVGDAGCAQHLELKFWFEFRQNQPHIQFFRDCLWTLYIVVRFHLSLVKLWARDSAVVGDAGCA
ncbi:unnamed protein product [Heligmosomoides polygyrus]|uniref:Sulfate_transp domain-containing protein n=1 Tax=Heligmosomoides polygyrus TaxID=6339 RepID=A0A183GC57_HELPZ|nr:unnamed protein product [Heligmosomoides polygyrus]